MIHQPGLKALIWIGSSRADFRKLPKRVQARMGYALYVAQCGGKHLDAEPLKGFGGAGVVEAVSDYRGDTFRCVYSVRFAGSIYVLHAFQKKSKTGRETPKAEMELIRRRLREADQIARGKRS
jgi:phage-related protein